MVLQVQPVDLPFASGINQKTDPKTLPVGSMLTATNAVFDKDGAVRKRNGFTALSTSLIGGSGTITAGAKVFPYQSGLCMIDGASLYTYSPASGTWTTKGRVPEVSATRGIVYGGTNPASFVDGYTEPDLAYSAGYLYVTWRDANGALLYLVEDATTGSLVVPPTYLGTTTVRHVVVSNTAGVFIFYVTGTSLNVVSIQSNIPGTFASFAVPGIALVNNAAPWDVTLVSAQAMVGYVSSAGLAAGALTMTPGGAPTAAAAPFSVDTSSTAWRAVAVGPIASNYGIAAARGTTGTSITVVFQAIIPAGVLSTYSSTTSASPLWVRVPSSIGFASLAGNSVSVVMGGLGTPGNASAMFVLNTSAGTWGYDSPGPYGPDLLSRPFVYNGRIYQYARVFSLSGASASDVLLDITAGLCANPGFTNASRIVATLAPRLSGNYTTYAASRAVLATPQALSPTTYALASFVIVNASPNSRSGLSATRLNFADPNRWQTAELNDELHIAGGLPSVFDGASVFEAGFAQVPNGITCTASTTGGTMLAGTYTYIAVFEHVDARGVRHQSTPSAAVAVTTTGTTGSVTIKVPGLTVTNRPSTRIVLYRTAAGGAVFDRLDDGMNTYTPISGQGSALVSIVDNVPDGGLFSGGGPLSAQPPLTLVSQGGAVPNLNPPAATCIVAHRGSIWLGGTDDGRSLWYSKSATPREAISFDDAFTVTCDDFPVTALASQDATLLAFTPRRIFLQLGDVPSDNGQGSSLQPLSQNQTDTGCISSAGIIRSPMGTWFQSLQGLYLYDRNGNVTYAGKNVEDTIDAAGTVTSGALVDTQGHLRWSLGANGFAVFDYVQGQWSTWTSPLGKTIVSSCMLNGTHFVLASDGTVYFEDPTTSLDAGTFVTLTISTAWFKAGSLTALQRIRRIKVLTDRLTEHDLSVSYAIDYAPTLYTRTFPSSSFVGNAIGEYEIHVDHQKCQAMRVQLSDAVPTGGAATGAGRGFSATVVTLLAGVKQGLYKQPATARS